MDSPLTNSEWLAGIERLLGSSAPKPEAELPKSCFFCRLDDQPDHLVPQRYLRPREDEISAGPSLFINPHCWFTRNGELPQVATTFAPLLDNFALQGEMVWVRDPAAATLLPFWLGPELSAWLVGLQAGDPAPGALPPKAHHTLARAGVLVSGDRGATCRRDWLEAISHAATQFRKEGYTPLGQLIHPFHLSALRRYYRHLIRTGQLALGDAQSSRRYVAHNESVARFFHHVLAATVAEIVAEAVKPSYVYLASYQEGARLEKHTDREQCEFSITFCLDYSPEPRRATPWPLRLHTGSSTVTVFQAIGDALLYRGRALPHSREPIPPGHTSTSIFFHYVRENLAGPLD
jgi:hypothetical protein